ncbi:hypothetical protein PCASD_16546 [Puccinia coronata f. sp. avenae]|uniref:Uncharacterized protein n=1 Tax=Puccinia coronata f. sp. avenae TaxID=200324 RepID=A0A2N5U2L8_9BASI|nr:hypothetical protein PCASD_16546 [Puccinia coronata f. sp. avenae]
MPFRSYLSKKLNPAHMNPELLINKYIPNLTAEPFQISKAYAERIYQQTNSPRLKKTLKNWSSWLTNSHNLSSGFKHKTSCFPTTSTISNDLLSSVPLQPLPVWPLELSI